METETVGCGRPSKAATQVNSPHVRSKYFNSEGERQHLERQQHLETSYKKDNNTAFSKGLLVNKVFTETLNGSVDDVHKLNDTIQRNTFTEPINAGIQVGAKTKWHVGGTQGEGKATEPASPYRLSMQTTSTSKRHTTGYSTVNNHARDLNSFPFFSYGKRKLSEQPGPG